MFLCRLFGHKLSQLGDNKIRSEMKAGTVEISSAPFVCIRCEITFVAGGNFDEKTAHLTLTVKKIQVEDGN